MNQFPARNALPFIVLVGRACSGKHDVANYLKHRHGFAKLGFADPLRDGVRTLYGVTMAELLVESHFEQPIERLRGKSVRELLQVAGDHVREVLGRDYLVRRLVERAIERGDWQNSALVVPDARTDLELAFAREAGARVWWLQCAACEATGVRSHPTEAISALRLMHFIPRDVTLNNDGTLEELYEAVDQALEAQERVAA